MSFLQPGLLHSSSLVNCMSAHLHTAVLHIGRVVRRQTIGNAINYCATNNAGQTETKARQFVCITAERHWEGGLLQLHDGRLTDAAAAHAVARFVGDE